MDLRPTVDFRRIDQVTRAGAPSRVLITGANSMLGRAFAKAVAELWPDSLCRALQRAQWDVTDRAKVADLAAWIGPGWIFHCAGLVDMEACEADPQEARNIIVGGAHNVAQIARISHARVFYPQSVFIYDGATSPITETTVPNPRSVYGTCKLAAETLISRQSDRNLVVRLNGFFGGLDRDTNFVGWIVPTIADLVAGNQASLAVGGRVWQPTYTADIARNVLALCALGKQGVYTLASHGETTFFDLTKFIAARFGWHDQIEIVPGDPAAIARDFSAARPDRLVIANRRLGAEGLDMQRSWQAALTEYLDLPFFDRYRCGGRPAG